MAVHVTPHSPALTTQSFTAGQAGTRGGSQTAAGGTTEVIISEDAG